MRRSPARRRRTARRLHSRVRAAFRRVPAARAVAAALRLPSASTSPIATTPAAMRDLAERMLPVYSRSRIRIGIWRICPRCRWWPATTEAADVRGSRCAIGGGARTPGGLWGAALIFATFTRAHEPSRAGPGAVRRRVRTVAYREVVARLSDPDAFAVTQLACNAARRVARCPAKSTSISSAPKTASGSPMRSSSSRTI